MEIVRLSGALGAEIRGVDASRPIDDASFAPILDAWHRYQVILLRDQDLDEEAQVRFAERFGPLSPIHTDHHSPTNKAVMYIGNREKDAHQLRCFARSENIRGAVDNRRDSIIGQCALYLSRLGIIRHQHGDIGWPDFLAADLDTACQEIGDFSCNCTGLSPTIVY